MYITPRQKKRYILNILFIALAIPLTVLAGYTVTQIISNAATEAIPANVATSNLTTNSLTLTWTTEVDAEASVIVNKEGQPSEPFRDFRGDSDRKTHYVEIIDLEPDTQYSFTIVSNGREYASEGGNAFEFKTSPLTQDTPVPNPIYGTIPDQSGDDAIVYIFTSSEPRSLPLSAVPSTTGNWIVDLSALRSLDGSSLVPVSAETQLTILVQGPDNTGAKHTGSYSATFDGGGKLDSSVDLALQEGVDIAQDLPDGSLVGTVGEAQPTTASCNQACSDTVTCISGLSCIDGVCRNASCDTETDCTCPTADPDPEPDPDPDPNPTPEKPEFDPSQRQFRIVQDVPWIDMFPGANTSGDDDDNASGETPNIPFDEASLKVVNKSDNGFGVVWMTENSASGYIRYGTSASTLTEEANDVRDGLVERGTYYSHLVELNDLEPETQYYYEVVSGSDTFDDGGSPFTFTTFSTLQSPPPFETISGTVIGAESIDDVVVLVQITDEDGEGTSGDSNYVAVVLDSRGGWIASVGDVRDEDGSVYYEYTDGDELTASMYIFAETSPVVISGNEIPSANIELEAVLPYNRKDLSNIFAFAPSFALSLY